MGGGGPLGSEARAAPNASRAALAGEPGGARARSGIGARGRGEIGVQRGGDRERERERDTCMHKTPVWKAEAARRGLRAVGCHGWVAGPRRRPIVPEGGGRVVLPRSSRRSDVRARQMLRMFTSALKRDIRTIVDKAYCVSQASCSNVNIKIRYMICYKLPRSAGCSHRSNVCRVIPQKCPQCSTRRAVPRLPFSATRSSACMAAIDLVLVPFLVKVPQYTSVLQMHIGLHQ